MADRTVTVRLNAAVSGYIAQMQAAGRATAQVGQQATGVAKQAGLISPKLLGIGSAAAVVGGMAVSKMANFEAALSEVKAATGESAAGMAALKEAAKDAGGATKYSAEEAAKGITNLAKAGVSTADILDGGLTGALDLAAAGSMDVADAAEIASAALVTFKLEGSDMAHVADLLAAGAGKAMGEVSDLGYALRMTGTVAAQTGLSIEETTAGLAAMASRGLTGSDAGTSFKSFLQRLVPESLKAATAMEEIGLAAYDAQGNFVGLEEVARQLADGMADYTDEQKAATLKTIFGSDAIRAAAIMYEEGAAGVQKWTEAVDDAGYASEYAATLTDNLKGDIEKLTGAVDTLMVSTAEGSNGPLRNFVQTLTGALDAVNDAQSGEGWMSWLSAPIIPDGAGTQTLWDKILGDGGDQAAASFAALGDYVAPIGADMQRMAEAGGAVEGSLVAQADAAAQAAAELEGLNKAYLASIDAALRASDAAINWEAAIDDATATIKENGKTVDIGTEKGRENARAINDMASAAAGVIAQMIEQGDAQEDVADKAETMAAALEKAAIKAGYSETEAAALADTLREVPDTVETQYTPKGLPGYVDAAEKAKDAANDVPTRITTTWYIRREGSLPSRESLREYGGQVRHSGGWVHGSGDVPITAQGGEYVIRRQQAMANADLVRAINNGSGPVSGGGGVRIDVGGVTVQQASNPVAAGYNVIDALAEAAYRQVVR